MKLQNVKIFKGGGNQRREKDAILSGQISQLCEVAELKRNGASKEIRVQIPGNDKK